MIEKVHLWHNKTDGIWDGIIDVILKGVNDRVKERGTDLNLTTPQLSNSPVEISANDINIVVFPLFEIKSDQLLPSGLISICSNELYKKSNFHFNTIFLIANRSDMPDTFNPHRDMTYYAKNLIRNPKFGGMGKALLMLELIFKQKEVINIVDIYSKKLLDDVLLAILAIKEMSKLKGYDRWRAKFYETFVGFYDDFQNDNKTHIDLNVPEALKSAAFINTDKKITWENLQQTNDFYNQLNGALKQGQSAHHVPLELFRAPIPFPLQELVDARDEISEELKKGGMDKKIKLLLIDNRSDNKFIVKNETDDTLKVESLCNLLFSEDDGFGLGDIFEIQMLGKSVYKKKDKDNVPQFYQNDNDAELSNYSDFKGEYEEFKFKKFKNKKSLEESEKKYHKAFIHKQNESVIENYADLVYHKAEDAHFVLLDFFLDDDDTYMALDFIRDMADIKRQKGDVSTTWYFITSAVYDSVVKYSQSGLLAEYYESAVVNAGDDPTNEKRQIIFLYKLLTFINARIKSFSRYKDLIFERMLSERKGDKERPECCVKVKKNGSGEKREDPACQGECGKDKCLEEMQTAIKRYLTEYDNIYSLFYDEKDEYKAIVELLDDTITKFLLLPEADWQIIQHQIDYINAKLRKAKGKRQFSCSYINKEIEQRSKIY